MGSPHLLKGRMISVKNIRQITKAMELVAATKMRKSQEKALASRPYAFTALHVLRTLTTLEGGDHALALPSLFVERPANVTLIALVTSDKGLAGSFNAAVLKVFDRYIAREGIDLSSPAYACVAIGGKALAHLKKYGVAPIASFTRVGDYTTVAEVMPIATLLLDGYEAGRFDRVIMFSTYFRNALKQDVIMRELLPVRRASLEALVKEITPTSGRYSDDTTATSLFDERAADYLLEPSPEVLLASLGRHLVLMQVYHAILEANASEHAARRTAMKSASDNAKDLSERLTLEYNKSRQAAITKELIEISAGTASQQR